METPILKPEFYSVLERTITFDGRKFIYKFHKLNPDSSNLVTFVPGWADAGEDNLGRLLNVQKQPDFNAITFSYAKPYDPNIYAKAITHMILNEGRDNRPIAGVVLQATSLGGVVVWNILASELSKVIPIKGIIFQGPVFQKESPAAVQDSLLSSKISHFIKRGESRPLKYQGGALQTSPYDLEVIRQMYDVIGSSRPTLVVNDIPTLLISFDKDRLVDPNIPKILQTHFSHLTTNEFPSSKKRFGHDTLDWNPVMTVEGDFINKVLGD